MVLKPCNSKESIPYNLSFFMKKYLLVILSILIVHVGYSQSKTDKDFYNTDQVKEIRITFKHNNWAVILDSLRSNGSKMLVGTANIDGAIYKNIGVRYRGSKSFTTGGQRNPLFIKLNYIDKKQKHQGYKRLKLSNALRDPSMVREVLGYEIARKYMIAPKAGYAKVYINQKYYGLFTNIEAVDSEFLEEHFKHDDNVLIKCTPDIGGTIPEGCMPNVFGALAYEADVACYMHNYELESDDGWGDLIYLTDVLNNHPEKIESVLAVDQTLWMLAFNNVLVNLSSYSGRRSQNYYLYQNDKGQFTPVIWDLNLAFGSFKSVSAGSDLDLKQLQELDPLLHIDNPYKPLLSQLLKNETYKKTYLAHIRSIVYDNFENGWYETRANELQTLIQGPFLDDKNQVYTYSDFKNSLTTTIGKRSKIPGIVELMSKRSKMLKKHPALRVIPPTIEDVQAVKREQYASEQIKDFTIISKVDKLPKKVSIYYRYSGSDDFLVAEMKDDGKLMDKGAKDKKFTATIKSNGHTSIDYYIVAENAAAISFSPANYMFELHSANLMELN